MEARSNMKRSWTFGMKIAIGFTISCLMVVIVGVVGYRSIEQLVLTSRRVTHTYAVLQNLTDLISTMKDCETGVRGYVITGTETYLEPYRPADTKAQNYIRQIRELTADNPGQQRRLDLAENLVQSHLAVSRRTLEVRRSQGFDAAMKIVATNEAKAVMDKLRQVIVEMDGEERRLLSERNSIAEQGAANSEQIILFTSLFSFILVGLIGWFITRSLTLQIGSAAAHVQSSSAELQAAANQQAAGSTEQATAMNEVATVGCC